MCKGDGGKDRAALIVDLVVRLTTIRHSIFLDDPAAFYNNLTKLHRPLFK